MNQTSKQKSISTKQLVITGMFAALSYVLMLVHFPVKYMGFLELELSDIPAIIATFAYGPIFGVFIELVKNLIKMLTASTTGGTGEIANFIVSIGYIIPLGICYHKLQTKYKTFLACVAAVVGMVFMGIVINYFVTVPLYAALFGGEEAVVALCSQVIPAIHDVATVVILGITPFNIVKGIMISVIGVLGFRSIGKLIK